MERVTPKWVLPHYRLKNLPTSCDMKKSLLGSVSLHALIVLVALFSVQTANPFELKPVEAIQVDISKITDSTKVKAQSKSAEKPVEKPKAKASQAVEKVKPQEKVTEEKKLAAKEPAKAEPPPEPKKPEPKKPEPEKPEPKKPEPKKVEDTPINPDPLRQMLEAEEAELKLAEVQKKKDEAKKKKAEDEKLKKEAEAKEKAVADAKAKADAKKKLDAEKKAKKLDVAQLEELLNKETEESSAPVEKKDEAGTPEKAEKDIQGNDEAMSATIIDGLRQRFSECWDVPPSVRESKETVDLKWSMTKSGKVVSQPVVIGGNGGGVAQQAAIAAVMACSPYDWLPAERYDLWKEIEWTFAPR
jgi:TolA protein